MSRHPKKHSSTGNWDSIAHWYDGWMGPDGSRFHRELAIPLALELANLQRDHRVLDVGCGQGVLVPHVRRSGGEYVGVDASRVLIERAVKRHGRLAGVRFVHCDAVSAGRFAPYGPFHVAILLLCVQDMASTDMVFRAVRSALAPGGRIVVVMTHPCFGIPRMTGWGVDPDRKLVFRRIDGYITSRRIPLRLHGRKRARTYCYHRPLQEYVRVMVNAGFRIDALLEKAMTTEQHRRVAGRASSQHNADIPVLLGIRAMRD